MQSSPHGFRGLAWCLLAPRVALLAFYLRSRFGVLLGPVLANYALCLLISVIEWLRLCGAFWVHRLSAPIACGAY